MGDDEEIPDPFINKINTSDEIYIQFDEKSETNFVNSNGAVVEESDKNAEEFTWPAYDYSWQDFVPAALSSELSHCSKEVPSLLSIVSDVSDTLPNGALWFNFAFDWWFTEPLEPIDEPSDPTINRNFPCAKCGEKFQHDWEVSRHFIDIHVVGQPIKKEIPPPPKEPSPEPIPEPEPKPEPESEPEIYVEPYDLLLDWRWEDFLPDWSESFLPSPFLEHFNSEDIEDDDPDPPPQVIREPTPPPPPQRKVFVLVTPAPVLKQTKYHCRTCDLIICNSCFSKKCGAHNVEFKGTAKFACGLC